MRTVRRWTWLMLPLVMIAGPAGVVACGEDGTGPCCNVRSLGKPCGDACISRSDTCRAGRGCACDG